MDQSTLQTPIGAKSGPIGVHSDELFAALATLEGELAQLEARLSPILGMSNEPPKVVPDSEGAPMSPMAYNIAERIKQVHTLIRFVVNVIDRVEL